MKKTKISLIVTLHRIMIKGAKGYCMPAPNRLIGLLAAKHSNSIGRRWLFQCLRDLEDEKLITRRKRYKKDPDGGFKQLPSLISITLKGGRLLFALGVEGAQRLCKSIMSWARSDDKRFPKTPEPAEKPPEREVKPNLTALGDILPNLKFT